MGKAGLLVVNKIYRNESVYMENMDIGLESEAENDTFVARKREKEILLCCFFLMNYVISFFYIPTHKFTNTRVI